MKYSTSKLKTGFTIIELLVASAVSVLLMGLFLGVTTNILDAWTQSRDSLSSNAKARMILNTLTVDLESAIIRNDKGVWLACDILETTTNSGKWNTSANQKPSDEASLEIDLENVELNSTDYRFGVAGSWIRFFTSPIDASISGDFGDVNAVAYQLIRREPRSRSSDADESYNLYRSVVRSDYTMKEITEDKGFYIDTFDGEEFEGQAGEIIAPRNDASLIARDVVDFGVVFYERDSSNRSQILFPKQGGPKQFRVPADGIPSSVGIFVRILDDEGAKQINAYERGLIPSEDPDFWWNTVLRFSKVYTKRIYFQSDTL